MKLCHLFATLLITVIVFNSFSMRPEQPKDNHSPVRLRSVISAQRISMQGQGEYSPSIVMNPPDNKKVSPTLEQKAKDTALLEAAQKGNLEQVKQAIENYANINAVNNQGQNALVLALGIIEDKNLDLIRYLINQTNIDSGAGKQPAIVLAVMNKLPQTLRLFLTCNKIDINKTTETGKTALHYAVQLCNLDFIDLLIMAQANINCRDCRNVTPLNEAAKIKNKAIFYKLLDCRADVLIALIAASRDKDQDQIATIIEYTKEYAKDRA